MIMRNRASCTASVFLLIAFVTSQWAVPPARALKPTVGHRVLPTDDTHTSIVEKAVTEAHLDYFSITKPTKAMTKATKALVDADAAIDTLFGGLFNEANHFDAEKFVDGQNV